MLDQPKITCSLPANRWCLRWHELQDRVGTGPKQLLVGSETFATLDALMVRTREVAKAGFRVTIHPPLKRQRAAMATAA